MPVKADLVLAEQAELRRSGELAVDHRDAGDGALLGNDEQLANLGAAERLLPADGLEQVFHGLLHVIDGLVDDVVELDLHAGLAGDVGGRGLGLHVEAHDDAIRGGGQHHVALGDAAHALVDDGDLDLGGGELGEGLGRPPPPSPGCRP